MAAPNANYEQGFVGVATPSNVGQTAAGNTNTSNTLMQTDQEKKNTNQVALV